jgi:hypothetical protein
MAEARAMRRCLKRAFPVGLASFEDVQDMPDYSVGAIPLAQDDLTKKKAEPKAESKKDDKITFKQQLTDLLEKR